MLLNVKVYWQYFSNPIYKQTKASSIHLNKVDIELAKQVKYHGVLLYASFKDKNGIRRYYKPLYCSATEEAEPRSEVNN